MRYTLIAVFCIMGLSSCKHSKYSKEAIKLNDSAVAIMMKPFSNNKKALNDAIVLLNKATEIDSSYITAYLNKFNFQNQLNEYHDAIITGEKLKKKILLPAPFILILGEDYERIGDNITAEKYYNQALISYGRVLDTMKIDNRSYNEFRHQKALTLILLRQQKKASELLRALLNDGTDTWNTETYKREMNIEATRDSLVRFYKIDTVVLRNKNTTTLQHEIDEASKPTNNR